MQNEIVNKTPEKKNRSGLCSLDLFLKYFSWLTIIALIAMVVVRKTGFWMPPAFVTVWLIPILTAGAVGYLTNWIAILLLFQPYKKKFGFLQGVIPSKKAELGKELGEIIPEYLLKPEELSADIGKLVRNYLQNPNLLDDVRKKINVFLVKHSGEVADFLIPYIESALRNALKENLTAEKLSNLVDQVVIKWISDENNRALIANAIVAELQLKDQEIQEALRAEIREGTKSYVKEEHPILSTFGMDTFAASLVDSFDWQKIGEKIKERLGNEKTKKKISEELVKLALKLKDWLQTADAQDKLGGFLAEKRGEMEVFLRAYLAENLPDMVNNCMKKDDFWVEVQTKFIPMLQDYVQERLDKEKENIIAGFNIPGKIETSVRDMDMEELHKMLLRASDNNLTVIQILGYFLGAACGVLLIFAS